MPTSVPVQPTITEAGLAAIFNAQSTGVEFALTHIAFGTGQYVPDGTETALQAEKVRVTIAGGGRISPTQIQIYAIAQAVAGSPFFVGEVGFFGDDGTTLLAVYSSTATPNLFLSDTVSTSVSYALGLAALPASSVTVTIDPSASAALLIIGEHVAEADPHPQYVEKVNGVAFYDPTLAFDQGAQIIGDDLLVYQSAQANNIGNLPSTSPAWWVPLYNYGDTPVTGLTNASVTLSSTQAARAHITLSGAITAALNIIFPTWVKDWTVVNNTTGAFALTCKTAAGTGIVIPQNGSPTRIRGDGTNITQPAENIAAATAPQHAVQFGQLGPLPSLTASVASSALTVGLNAPFPLWFRNATLGSGVSVSLPITSNLSITVPSGATLGTVSSEQAQLALLVAYNGGAPVLCIVNLASGIQLDETGLVSPTTISSGATAANVIYSASAVSANSPYRLLGTVTVAEATAGTWATAPVAVTAAGGVNNIAIGAAGLINNNGASSDVALAVGQAAYIDITAASTAALHIACADNQSYEIQMQLLGNTGGPSLSTLLPNNASLTNFFNWEQLYNNSSTPSANSGFSNGFVIAGSDIRYSKSFVSTKTTCKTVNSWATCVLVTSGGMATNFIVCSWQAAASSGLAGDTTTAWTSLGTINFPIASSGRIIVRRVS